MISDHQLEPAVFGTSATMAGAELERRANFSLTILQVLPRLMTGGVERGTLDIANAIVRAGGRAIVASAGGLMVRELERAGAKHVTLPLHSKNPYTMWRNVAPLAELIRAERVDIVHARSRAPAWSARAAARRAGVPFVTTFHGTYNFRSGLKKRFNSVMAGSDRMIAISDFIADHVRTHYRTPDDRIEVIYRGIDLDIFNPRAVPVARIEQLAQYWRLTDGLPVVMLPGRLSRWKGQTVFLQALTKLHDIDFVGLIVGSAQDRASYRDELEESAQRLGLETRLRLVDETRDMPAAFMLADVVISASTDPEAFGRVIVEAQAMGRPVIATDHGASRETIIAGETGWLVPPGDPDALAVAIRGALALGPLERQRMADAAEHNARSRFSKQMMCEKTLAVYRRVAAEARARRGQPG
jgi:glycosyltransferase involved in cell wall biosynthesis